MFSASSYIIRHMCIITKFFTASSYIVYVYNQIIIECQTWYAKPIEWCLSICNFRMLPCLSEGAVSSLVELSSKAVACYIPFEVVEHFPQPIPEQLQLRIAFWSFPENEEDIRYAYVVLSHGTHSRFHIIKNKLYRAHSTYVHVHSIGALPSAYTRAAAAQNRFLELSREWGGYQVWHCHTRLAPHSVQDTILHGTELFYTCTFPPTQ